MLKASFKTLPFDRLNPELVTAGIGRAGKPGFDMLSPDVVFTVNAQLQGQPRSLVWNPSAPERTCPAFYVTAQHPMRSSLFFFVGF